MHGARPALPRQGDGAEHIEPQRAGVPRHARGLHQWRRGLDLGRFLEGAQAKLLDRRMAGEQQQRHLASQRRGQAGHRVGVALPAGDQRHAAFAGQPCPGIGHMHRRGLVPDMDDFDPLAESGIIDRHDVVA